MSVTVADLLKLPSLKPARVVAGAGGLSRTVAYVSVLEYADPQALEDELFPEDTYSGSEIVITGFINNPRDERLQCAVVRRLAEAGEVGLILYYVGVYMPAVPEEMKRIAEEKDFVLILMPEGRMDFRYGEAICEIMERIVRDRMANPAFVSELLEQVSRLPGHQRTVDTMLKMLSERMMASFLLTDGSLRVLNEATWPHSLGKTLRDYLESGALPEPEGEACARVNGSDYRLSRVPVRLDQSRCMELFIFREGEPLPQSAVEQAGDAVRLAASIWSTQHDAVAVRELVRAILQDEPMKMRRLADIFHIDVASIHSMLILHGEREWDDGNSFAVLQSLRELFCTYFATVVADVYEGELVLFVDGPGSLNEEREIQKELDACLAGERQRLTITWCNHLADTTAVREAFLLHREYRADACKLFPHKSAYHTREMEFARACRLKIAGGETVVYEAQKPLEPIRREKDEGCLDTLEVYLLDAQCSYQRTGDLLFLHKNTVKYRLARCSDLVGYHIGDFPDTLPLYYAVAVRRLLRAEDICPK